MSVYSLRVDAGRDGRRDEVLHDDIYRVGSDPSCQITVRCRSPHALTVYRRQGQFHLVNKSRQSVRLGRRVLGPGDCSHWTPGQRVAFEGISLALRQGEDAAGRAPSLSGRSGLRAPAVRETPDTGSTSTKSKAEEKKSQPRLQYAVIAVSLLLVVLMQWVAADAGALQDGRHTGLASISTAISDALAGGESGGAARRRAEATLQLIAQLTLAEELEETQNAQFARAELIALCTSIRDAADSGDAERQTAAGILALIR